MKTIIILMCCLNILAFHCEGVVDLPDNRECFDPGLVTCNTSNEKFYCSMDYKNVYVCTISADCETECMHELVNIMVDDIQDKLKND